MKRLILVLSILLLAQVSYVELIAKEVSTVRYVCIKFRPTRRMVKIVMRSDTLYYRIPKTYATYDVKGIETIGEPITEEEYIGTSGREYGLDLPDKHLTALFQRLNIPLTIEIPDEPDAIERVKAKLNAEAKRGHAIDSISVINVSDTTMASRRKCCCCCCCCCCCRGEKHK